MSGRRDYISDWVARYALNMAFHTGNQRLPLVHIEDDSFSRTSMESKIKTLQKEAEILGLVLTPVVLPLSADVALSLLSAIPDNAETMCVCGMRITSRGRGFLAGTISGKLLRYRKFDGPSGWLSPEYWERPATFSFPYPVIPAVFRLPCPFFCCWPGKEK